MPMMTSVVDVVCYSRSSIHEPTRGLRPGWVERELIAKELRRGDRELDCEIAVEAPVRSIGRSPMNMLGWLFMAPVYCAFNWSRRGREP